MIFTRRILSLEAVLSLFLLAGCLPKPSPELLSPWLISDLRLLDPDEAQEPTQDLIAAYMRQNGEELQIRLDFLEVGRFDEFDLYLALDTGPGGLNELSSLHTAAQISWDTLLVIPAHGGIKAFSASGDRRAGLAVLVVRDPVTETILISLNRKELADKINGFGQWGNVRTQVFLTLAGEKSIVDGLAPFTLDSPPPRPARYVLAFWDVFKRL